MNLPAFLLSLFSRRRPLILGGDAFGPPMNLTEVRAGFVKGKENPVWRAIGQIALAMREECIEHSARALSAEKPQQAAMHAGGANACAEFAQMLADLAEGRAQEDLKQWFREEGKS